MLRRSLLTTAAIPLAAALALSGCSGDGSGGDETASAAPTDSAEASASADPTDGASADPSDSASGDPSADPDESAAEAGDLHAAAGELAEGFPEMIPVLDGAEIVRSSWETPDEDGVERFSLVLKTDMSEDDILKAYQDGLGEHDFTPVGEASSGDGVTSLTFQKDSGAQLVTVSISADPDGGDGRLVSVGGQVKP